MLDSYETLINTYEFLNTLLRLIPRRNGHTHPHLMNKPTHTPTHTPACTTRTTPCWSVGSLHSRPTRDCTQAPTTMPCIAHTPAGYRMLVLSWHSGIDSSAKPRLGCDYFCQCRLVIFNLGSFKHPLMGFCVFDLYVKCLCLYLCLNNVS